MIDTALDAMPYREALQRVLALAPLLPAEPVPLAQCAGRVLAEDLLANAPRPAIDLSAMDGYALRHADVDAGSRLPICGAGVAGDPAGLLKSGHAYRILTGAAVPQGADTIIPQENVTLTDETIIIGTLPPKGANIRRAGEEFRKGDRLIAAGTRLDWRHVAMLACEGVAYPKIRRQLRATILASGKELVQPGGKLQPGQIFDSNSPMLAALFDALGLRTTVQVVACDEAASLRTALMQACTTADIVVTTGGISVGDTDHVHGALRDLGAEILFRGVTIRPGRPQTVATLGKTTLFGLPGNPTASVVGAIGLLIPFVRRAYGQNELPTVSGRLDFEPKFRSDLTQFVFVDLVDSDAGPLIRPARSAGTADIFSLLLSKGVLRIDPEAPPPLRGTHAAVIPFAALL
ncbi:molybdopterin molybdotransferase MoeA [Beijerinckia mobilis]|uniref:molybdopterin molybdotransferase MoeA n=1 Tax=Beijerinckia mobilis TaxID=231434 RepID=UPI0005513919|nr:molybdopterin molybdotransferase MoeA [Beijerinckia mobilis]